MRGDTAATRRELPRAASVRRRAGLRGRRAPGTSPAPGRARSVAASHTARGSEPACLSVAGQRVLRTRLTFRGAAWRKNPSPGPRGSRPSVLLPPRSALQVPPRKRTQALLRRQHALLPRCACAGSGLRSAPSIFGAGVFGRYVATQFLAGADFYGHRPAVATRPRPSSVCAAGVPCPRTRLGPRCRPCLPAPAH